MMRLLIWQRYLIAKLIKENLRKKIEKNILIFNLILNIYFIHFL